MALSVREILIRNPIFKCLSATELEAVLATTTSARVDRGKVVAGTEKDQPIIVVGFGVMKTWVDITVNGNALVLRLHGPGELANDVQLLDPQNRALKVTAARDSVVALVDRVKLIEIVTGNPQTAMMLARSYARATGDLYRRMVDTKFSLEARTAGALLRLAESYGDELENGDTLITLPMTRAELAGFIGVSIESVIRTLSVWRHDGAITTEANNTITLHDIQKLKTIGAELLAAYDA